MSDSQLVNTFVEITKKLNKEGIHPIVYGSLGLYLALNSKNDVNDIDFIINKPEDFLTCKEVLLKNGFRTDPDHERELIRTGLVKECKFFQYLPRSAFKDL